MTSLRKVLPLTVLAVAACSDSSRMAMGDVNSIIVVADDGLWAEVGDTVLTALQPRIFAVRQENTFNLTHTSPAGEHWPELRRFRQVLAIGGPDAPWLRPALAAADTTVEPPALVEATNVWARNQNVTALVVPETGAAQVVRARLPELQSLLDRRYRNWATRRMFISGHDQALADTLRRQGAFTMDIPEVYKWRRAADSVFVFLNDEPDASQLVRWVTVAWQPPPDATPTVESVVRWRDSLAAALYDWDQTTQPEPIQSSPLGDQPEAGIEVRGVWSATLDDFPQAGPFITRVMDCPAQDRRYLLDAWLYAPARDKYQYMIQLETLLDGFECGGVGG